MFTAEEIVSETGNSTAPAPKVEELPLPSDFSWGVATAAYQIEGGFQEDGKGPSIWDTFAHLEPSRTNGENGDVACDHYHRYADDVALMSSYGAEVYRFSICWSRIIPLGGRNDPVNEAGIAFYSRLLDSLEASGIEPVVTLYHWDLPEELHRRYRGFLRTDEFRADFTRYADVCFARFGDRVKKWITFNEPYIISIFGYHNGVNAPGRSSKSNEGNSETEPWVVGHSLILAHADAVELYTNRYRDQQNGSISIVLNGDFYEPYDASNDKDVAAAQRRMEFYIGWFADPIYLGRDYPPCMRQQLGNRLPSFTEDDQKLLSEYAAQNSFYGMNHYTSQFARARPGNPDADDYTGHVEELPVNSEGVEIGPLSGVSWLRVTPVQFQKLLGWIWDRYGRPIIVTENGCPCPGESGMSLEKALQDDFRVRYFGLYLDAISRAIHEDGVRVSGYYAWTFIDNYGT